MKPSKETPRILIIEDDESTRETFRDVFEQKGYDVTAVATAQEALQAGRKRFFHLLLIDVNLPDQSGIEVLHRLKTHHPDAEAVIITGYASLENVLQAFESASAYIEKPVDIPMLLQKVQQLLARQADRLKRQKEREQLERELAFYRELSNTDSLTKLYNSRYFRHMLTQEIRRATRYGRTLVLMMLDIDFFKRYNDRYGHVDADDALITLAQIFETNKRASDLVGRLGGEEFAFLLPETTAEKAYHFAERVRQCVEQTAFPLRDGGTAQLTISIGIAEFPKHASEPLELMRRADQALYVAKRSGRNQTRIYEPPTATH